MGGVAWGFYISGPLWKLGRLLLSLLESVYRYVLLSLYFGARNYGRGAGRPVGIRGEEERKGPRAAHAAPLPTNAAHAAPPPQC